MSSSAVAASTVQKSPLNVTDSPRRSSERAGRRGRGRTVANVQQPLHQVDQPAGEEHAERQAAERADDAARGAESAPAARDGDCTS